MNPAEVYLMICYFTACHELRGYILLVGDSIGNILTLVSVVEQEFQIHRKPDFITRGETCFRSSVERLAASG